jgi:hypothetical protein
MRGLQQPLSGMQLLGGPCRTRPLDRARPTIDLIVGRLCLHTRCSEQRLSGGGRVGCGQVEIVASSRVATKVDGILPYVAVSKVNSTAERTSSHAGASTSVVFPTHDYQLRCMGRAALHALSNFVQDRCPRRWVPCGCIFNMASPTQRVGRCDACARHSLDLKRCSRCHVAVYCSSQCQKIECMLGKTWRHTVGTRQRAPRSRQTSATPKLRLTRAALHCQKATSLPSSRSSHPSFFCTSCRFSLCLTKRRGGGCHFSVLCAVCGTARYAVLRSTDASTRDAGRCTRPMLLSLDGCPGTTGCGKLTLPSASVER